MENSDSNVIHYLQPVPDSKKSGRSHIYRHHSVNADGPILMSVNDQSNEVKTVKEIIKEAFKVYRNLPLFGLRENIAPDSFGEYQWITYEETHIQSLNLAKAFIHEELCPITKGEDGSQNFRFMGIYGANRPEWMIADFAWIFANIVTVPLYTALSNKGIHYIWEETGITSITCDNSKITLICKMKESGKLQNIDHLICYDIPSEEDILHCTSVGVKLLWIVDLYEAGKDLEIELENPSVDSIMSVYYTSGTTELPKGVVHTHRSFSVKMLPYDQTTLKPSTGEIHYSYLPLAHWFERTVVHKLVCEGASIGFTWGNMFKMIEDFKFLKPTTFSTVPRLLARLIDFLKTAMSTKAEKSENDFETSETLSDEYIELLGGNISTIIVGSAPVSVEHLNFVVTELKCKLISRYGLTEVNGGALISNPLDNTTGHVGGPIGVIEVTLEDIPEMEYFSTDVIDGNPTPRGEIWFRGSWLFSHYYKNLTLTKEAIDQEGFFHTGDIGMITSNGAIKIIGRKKQIFKLSQGEYISPEYLESVYTHQKLIKQIFVYGDSLQDYLVGIIVPDPDEVLLWANSQNMGRQNYEWIVNSKEFRKAMQTSIQEEAHESELKGFEIIKRFTIITEEFTPFNELLTPTFKLIRRNAKVKFITQIRQMYDFKPLLGDELLRPTF